MWLKKVREHLHQYPELGYQEFKTQEILISYLEEMNLSYKKMETGLVVDYGMGRPRILVRADIDGLPIMEMNDVPYRSKNDNMHACGHDVHMTVALGVLKHYYDKDIDFSLRVVFQPAEEGPGGAKMMIERGAVEDVDYALSLHTDPRFNAGEIAVNYGIRNAITDEVDVTITGVSAHAAKPHDGIDALVVASDFINSVNYILSKTIKPFDNAILQFGTINGGVAKNVICKDLKMSGTMRTLSHDVRNKLIKQLKDTSEGLEKKYGAKIKVEINSMYDELVNDNRVVDVLRDLYENTKVIDYPSLGGEDFGYFLKKAPGLMFSLGTSNSEEGLITHLHSDTYDVDPSCLEVGVDVMVKLIEELKEKGI